MANAPTKVVTGEGVLCYLHCWEPHAVEGGIPKYSVSFVFPKKDKTTYDKVVSAMKAAYEDGQSTLKGSSKSVPSFDSIKTPLRDGDEKDDEVYRDCWYFNASGANQPGIVDRDRNEILDRGEMYSGVIGRVAVNFYAYNKNGNKGIAAGLNNIQKIKDGKVLSGASRAEDDFNDGFEASDDDFLD